MLYNTLKTYFNDYYQQSPRSKPRTTFAISFYRPGLGGMNKGMTLMNHFPTQILKNRIDNIDAGVSSDIEFRKMIASVVYYMVKYQSTIIVKQGYSNSMINVLYASIFKILDEGYIKQNLNPNGQQIGGQLKNIYNGDAWLNSEELFDLFNDYRNGAFTLKNAFPIHLFSNLDDFDIFFAKLFNDLSTKFKGTAGDIFPTFSNFDEFLLLNRK